MMTNREAAWIRENVWTPDLARANYRHETTCTCAWPCPCEEGQHHYCLTPDGITPVVDVLTAIIWGSKYTAHTLSGILLHHQRRANVVHLPHQRPCRRLCQCDHPFHTGRRNTVKEASPTQLVAAAPAQAPARRPRLVPAGQMGLFDEAEVS